MLSKYLSDKFVFIECLSMLVELVPLYVVRAPPSYLLMLISHLIIFIIIIIIIIMLSSPLTKCSYYVMLFVLFL